MKGEIAVEIQRLMNRMVELESEKNDLRVKVNTEDLEILKEKLGRRCILLSVEDIRKDIERDIKIVQVKLDGFIGYPRDEFESKLRMAMQSLIRNVMDKRFGGYDAICHEQRIIISQMIEDQVELTMKQLR